MDIKQITKIAKACRKAGITSFKCPEFEFTVSDNLPEPKRIHKSQIASKDAEVSEPEKVETETLSDEALLFWSSQEHVPITDGN